MSVHSLKKELIPAGRFSITGTIVTPHAIRAPIPSLCNDLGKILRVISIVRASYTLV
jgi:hypothetical protein